MTLPAAGSTLGVEEEYHLLDPDTCTLINSPELAAEALESTAGPGLQPEMLTSQLEAATEVCTDLDELRRAIADMRRNAAAAAAGHGAAILATSTHPFAALADIEVLARPRYDVLLERFGTIVRQFNLCGCHVHVSVPDLDTAVAVMNLARPYLPVLSALTGSSPFHEGQDTGYESFRLPSLGLWPQGGPPPLLASAAEYRSTIEDGVRIGLVDDASAMLWDLRPSLRYPTLEFRAADMCPDIDDGVLYAALVRSLVRVLAARSASGSGPPAISDPALRAARWRAARYGLSDTLWSPARAELIPARAAVDELLGELRDDLETHDEYPVVQGLIEQLFGRGTSAARQRQDHTRTGDLIEVTRAAVRLTARP